MNKLLLLFFVLCTFGISPKHPNHAIYISVVKITHQETAPTATISMRVFRDDLKDILRNKFGYESIMEKPTFCQAYENYIQQYFKKEFVCTINNEPVKYYLVGCEKAEEVFQLEFEMECPIQWDSAKIEAPYFMELFAKQSNIIPVSYTHLTLPTILLV